MDDSAVSADAIKTGVSNDERFENLAADIHEYGKRHDEATCTDKSCGRCGKSTAGPALEGRQRAGDVRPDEGHLPEPQQITVRDAKGNERQRSRYDEKAANNPGVASGNIQDAISAAEHDPDRCEIPHCRPCNSVIEALLQPEYSISKGGGGGSGRKKKAVRPLTGPERIERRMLGGTPFDEGHTSSAPTGRPRIGREAREVRSLRIEPRDGKTIDATGISGADILAGYAAAIRMAKSGVSRKIIAAAMLDMVESAVPDLPQSA
jgi:hypothetical protein